MPRRRQLHRYPEEFYALFERAQHGPFELAFESEARARNVRAELYNMRAAVRDHVSLDPDATVIAERYLMMENVILELQNNVLQFRIRTSTIAEHIKNALNEIKEPS